MISAVVLSPSSERMFVGTTEGNIMLFSIKLTANSYFHDVSDYISCTMDWSFTFVCCR